MIIAKNRLHQALQFTSPKTEKPFQEVKDKNYWQVVKRCSHSKLVRESNEKRIKLCLKRLKGFGLKCAKK